MNRMNFSLREESAIFTMLCYTIRLCGSLTETEQAIYDKYVEAGWEDFVNKDKDKEG